MFMRVIFAAALATCASIAAAAVADAQTSLAQAERAFAADGLRDGIQKSFLAHFADDSHVFKPYLVDAPPWYRAHPDKGTGKLTWTPQYLAVSGAGDFGLSSGPWCFDYDDHGKPARVFGHFFSFWRRDAQGTWQVVFDHGIDHGEVALDNVPLVSLMPASGGKLGSKELDARKRALEAADDALRAALQKSPDAFASAAQADTLWLRDGALPLRANKPPAPAAVVAGVGSGKRQWSAVAASGDLGFTLGGDAATAAAGVDARVWHYTARGWRLLADLGEAAQ